MSLPTITVCSINHMISLLVRILRMRSSEEDRNYWGGGGGGGLNRINVCKCANKGADQLRNYRAADQRLCFCYTDSTVPLT